MIAPMYAQDENWVNEDELINHPPHYTAGGIEVFDFIESWNLTFAEGNVLKYVMRAPTKGDEVADLKKARWYLDKLIAKAERNAR